MARGFHGPIVGSNVALHDAWKFKQANQLGRELYGLTKG